MEWNGPNAAPIETVRVAVSCAYSMDSILEHGEHAIHSRGWNTILLHYDERLGVSYEAISGLGIVRADGTRSFELVEKIIS
jgi:hypothetical protein